MTCERMQEILDAYLDGETPPPDAREIEEHLHDCVHCAAALAARRALQQALRTKLPYHRAPAALRAHSFTDREIAFSALATERSSPSRNSPFPSSGALAARWWRRTALSLAACFALVCTAFIALLAARSGPPTPSLAWSMPQLVLSDHLRSLEGSTLASVDAGEAGHLIDVVSSDKHTVRPWFAGKLPFAPAVPELEGFTLLGGRLDMVLDQPAAAIVYRHDKHIINLFIWPRAKFESALAPPGVPTPHEVAGYHEVEFADDAFSYWAASDLETDELVKFARAYAAAAKGPPASTMH